MTYMRNDTYTSSVSSVFNLNTDIQLAGYSNWPGVETFRGRFNGNGHTIFVNIKPLPPTGASYAPIANNRAIFINVEAGAVIENLHVEGSVHGYNAGGIASFLDGGTIRNCTFSGDVSAETMAGDSRMNSLIAELENSRLATANDIEKYDDLTNFTSHNGRINTGGLVAVMEDGTITSCRFRGNVTSRAGATYSVAGGIAGRMFNGDVTDCSVVGDSVISASTTTTADNSLAEAGGIVGYAVTPLASTIEGCTFEGSVDSTYYAGGIAGLARGTIISGDEVLANSEIAGTYSAGGIAGYLGSGGQAVNNSVKAGAIVYADTYSAGGIVGYLDTGSQAVRGNTSDAAIRGTADYLGGIVGAVSNSTNANIAVGTGNEYSGASAGIGRDEYNRATDGKTKPKQDAVYVITTSKLDDTVVGVRYEAILDTNAAQTLAATWTYSGVLPGGLDFGNGGRIAGTPTEAGDFVFSARANIQGIGYTASKDFTLKVTSTFDITPKIEGELSATQGEYFEQKFSATKGALLSVKGSLPSGVTASPAAPASSIMVSGYPASAGTYTFKVEGTSGDITADTGDITLVVAPALELATTSLTPATATVNTSYSANLETYINADKTKLNENSLAWSISGGALPGGLSISGGLSGGKISGTPTGTGTFTFTVRAELTLTAGTSTLKIPAEGEFTLTVGDGSGTTSGDTPAPTPTPTSGDSTYSLTITTDSIPDGKAGTPYSTAFDIDTSDYAEEVTWSIYTGTLPPGLSLDRYGTLSGTPTRAGEYSFMVQVTGAGAAGRKRFTLTIAPAFSITTDAELESAKVGTYYSITLATDRAQALAVRWELLSGDLPAGLALNPINGSISGTPTQVEIATFTIQATAGGFIAVKRFTLAVGPAIEIEDETQLPNGKVGAEYSHTFSADLTYSVNWTLESGTLPPGLTFKDGTLSGTPTTRGTYTFTLTIESGGMSSSKEFTLTIDPALSITTEAILPAAKIGASYSFTFETDAPAGSRVLWTLYTGNYTDSDDARYTRTLPSGMYIDEETGTLFGAPTTEGLYRFGVEAVMGNVSAVKYFTLNVRPILSIMTESPLPHAELYELYRTLLSADAEEGQVVTWSLAGGTLPIGLTLNESSGLLSGYPDTEGLYTFTVSAFCNGLTATKEFTLTVGPVNTITNALIPVLNAGEPFTLALSAGNTSGAWSITEGRLPPGLELNANTGVISGTPVRAGTYVFTVQNVSGYSVAEKELTIIVDFVITAEAYLPSGTTGESYSYKFTAHGVSANSVLWSASRDVFPAGIRLGTDGLLSGTTNESGTYNFTVSAFVSNDVSAQKMVTLDMFSRSALPILNVSLASGTVGQDYFDEMQSSIDGAVWTLAEGELPPGITLRPDGVIMGVPTEAGTYYPVIRGSVSSRAGSEARSGTKRFEITIAPKPEVQQSTGGGGGGGCSSGFGVLGLVVLAGAFRKR